jgi:recombinational DNA repair protein RecR
MTILSIITVVFATVFIAYFLISWADSRPCSYCSNMRDQLKERMPHCDGCDNIADVYYCTTCIKKLFKKRTPRIRKFLQLLRSIKKIRRSDDEKNI